jgi:aminoglycoside 3-N-acetyltransferase
MVKSEIEECLGNINLPKNEILFLHVRLKGISDYMSYTDLSKQIIEVLNDLYTPKTILVPTFTYSFTKTGIYDIKNSASEVGRFSEEIRKQFDPSHRTRNPVFNVIDTNKYLSKFQLKEESAFSKDSMFCLIHELGHVIVNINIDGLFGTYLHFLEYYHNVPYRYNKSFLGKKILSNQKMENVDYQYYVRDLDKDTAWDREKIKSTLLEEGGLENYKFEDFEVRWSHSKQIDRIIGQKLDENKNFLII